jgi:hypothetical protein
MKKQTEAICFANGLNRLNGLNEVAHLGLVPIWVVISGLLANDKIYFVWWGGGGAKATTLKILYISDQNSK